HSDRRGPHRRKKQSTRVGRFGRGGGGVRLMARCLRRGQTGPSPPGAWSWFDATAKGPATQCPRGPFRKRWGSVPPVGRLSRAAGEGVGGSGEPPYCGLTGRGAAGSGGAGCGFQLGSPASGGGPVSTGGCASGGAALGLTGTRCIAI